MLVGKLGVTSMLGYARLECTLSPRRPPVLIEVVALVVLSLLLASILDVVALVVLSLWLAFVLSLII